MIEVVNKIYGRGKNRDVYGNPYMAAVVITNVRRIVLPMCYTGDSSESGVLRNVLQMLIDRKIRVSEDRVKYNYTKVRADSRLEHPSFWRIEGMDMKTVYMRDIPTVAGMRWPANLRPYNIKRF